MRGLRALLAGSVIFAAACGFASASAEVHVPEGREEAVPEGDAGLALKYPNDKGIGDDPDVVFTEDFETRDIAGFKGHWSSVKNQADALSFSGDVPKGSPGRRSLGMTARRGRNEGGHLFNRFKPGWDELYARCYVKLSADYGLNHHFVKLQGAVNPPPYPMGGAGSRPTTSWTTGLEPTTAWKNTYPGKSFAPPGHWFFYSYWPEMHSFQTPEGKGTKFYGNAFAPWKPVMVERGRWICLEWMVRMNSAPEKPDGAQRFWIDGKLVGDWSPGKPKGYWMRDKYGLQQNNGTYPSAIGAAGSAERDSGNSADVEKFFDWAHDVHPADDPALILWDHGAGWFREFCEDDTSGSGMLPKEFEEGVLGDIETENGGDLEILGFDACLMGSAEIAYQFRNHVQYFIGSEELEGGGGWDWEDVCEEITDHSTRTPAQYADAIVDQGAASASVKTLSATRLSVGTKKIADLRTEVEALATLLMADSYEFPCHVIRAREDTEYA